MTRVSKYRRNEVASFGVITDLGEEPMTGPYRDGTSRGRLPSDGFSSNVFHKRGDRTSEPITILLPLRLGQGSHAAATASNQSLLLDKLRARTSTPDSEALASSDDEGDDRQESAHSAAQSAAQREKPVRRPSWLSETSQTQCHPRRESFATGSMSPTSSHPTIPSAETCEGAWGSHSASSVIGRTRGSSTFPWGTGIWNAEREDPPARPSVVLPSSTSTMPPGAASNSLNSDIQTSPVSRDPGPNSQIPFAIPLHTTTKTYCSQSYSVGQLDPKATAAPPGMSSSTNLGRARYPALQHRPSRPSMLSDIANDGTMLGKIKEVEDDDDESPSESLQGSFHQSSDAETTEMLARENAILRHQNQYNAPIRPPAVTGSAYIGNGYSLRESVPEESDFAVDELDEENEPGDMLAKRALNRRMSEFESGSLRAPSGVDSCKADNANLNKALWSSSLGFPVTYVPQSKRHSFANMPTRQRSISSIPDSASTLEPSATDIQQPQEYPSGYPDAAALGAAAHGEWMQRVCSSASNHTPTYPVAGRYFGGGPNMGDAFQPGFPSQYPSPSGPPNPYASRAPSPHCTVYSIAQPRHNQLLHIILFKCARPDVFYIQEGTGFAVKPGDLVIVEADRGTDLGTVAKDNVDWQTAKELKEHYAEEQYKWLMMYSQCAAAAQEGASAGRLASSTGFQGSAVGGREAPNQHHVQENVELRPKLIKRLAQSHEVHALRDKERQEAKAKRVCMQKVKEHGLNMEILDAEFQVDRKKLTFYYFAGSYINFKSLVTDLFKIYKTRIWIPTLSIQTLSGIGPGAVGVNRATGDSDRRQNQQNPRITSSVSFRSWHARRPRVPANLHSAFRQRHSPCASFWDIPRSNNPYGQFSPFGNPRSKFPKVWVLFPPWKASRRSRRSECFVTFSGLHKLGDTDFAVGGDLGLHDEDWLARGCGRYGYFRERAGSPIT
ncbi:hypothetical protein FOFC_15784 [Fusarium oxysporum]|nr:hypothetical protein FOFC_15784 [Fusarium oxysporum]